MMHTPNGTMLDSTKYHVITNAKLDCLAKVDSAIVFMGNRVTFPILLFTFSKVSHEGNSYLIKISFL